MIGLSAVYGVRETLAAGVPRCEQDVTLGCRLLAELEGLVEDRIDPSVLDVNVAEFQLLLEATTSCAVGDSLADCEFWERWGTAMFEKVDENGDGIIDTHEKLAFSEGFEHELHIDAEITEEENMSGVPPGTVSKTDFVDGFKAHMLAEAFLAADLDGNFVISLTEMEAIAGNPEAQAAAQSLMAAGQNTPWLEQIDMSEIIPLLAALPTAHLYDVLLPVVHGNQAVLGLDSKRRRLFFFFVCIWLCTAAVAAVAGIATGAANAGNCEFSEHSRLGQLERRNGRCH